MKFRLLRASASVMDAPCPTPGAMRDGYDWVVEIPDLPALMALIEREGSLVIDAESIWIYDAHME